MFSNSSEEVKSSSGTSESDRQIIRKKLNSFQYPSMPLKDYNLRKRESFQRNRLITTNLYEIKFVDEFHKFALYKVEILPEIAEDNYTLKKQIYSNIELPKSFKKSFWAGNNLYTLITEEKGQNYDIIKISEEINKIKYNVQLKKIKDVSFKKINCLNEQNLHEKSIIENIFRNIIMKNPKVIKFHDRTIFEIDPKNIINVNSQYKENIYKGYITSAYITENGLYMQINNRNKYISGKTALQKMSEIKNKLKQKILSPKEIHEQINDFFYSHKTVLTTYGSLKAYKIKEADFDKHPSNTNITVKDCDGNSKTVSLINYYKNQYNVEIKNINQPLLIAENNTLKNKNKSTSDKNNNLQNENDYVIYIVPELVYITGIEEENQNNRRNSCRNIVDKTKTNPTKKMSDINGLFKLINTTNKKKIKKKNGKEIELKSPKELIDEWGIKLGNNLTFEGRIIPPPKLLFRNNKIEPKNGIYRADKPYKCATITNDNIFYVYDKNERKSNHQRLFKDLIEKFKSKDFSFSKDFNSDKVRRYGLENTDNWDNIYMSLRKINLKNNEKSFGIIFCSQQLEKFYTQLKNYFSIQFETPTQHIITRNIENPKRANSIQFNIIDQINIKMGGFNFYIDFKEEGIIKSGQVFLIIGLDSKSAKKKITYSMTSTNNSRLNDFVTQEETCDDITQEKNNILEKMFKVAIDRINRNAPHSPDYIIIYRQGGNEVRNKILTITELDNFTGVLKKYKEKYKDKKNYNFKNTKLYYICCNLKSDLKFFETETKNKENIYKNPQSGSSFDDKFTQQNKYEFYLQPQYVNQGTATPCHYQVMYFEKSQTEEDELKIENLEKLTFYLSFYYWTWAGAIRTPSLLKMSNTAMNYYSKIVHDNEYCFFIRPTYI